MSECFGKNHYFALFDAPVAFVIDKHHLKQQLIHLQKKHHPDNQIQAVPTISSELINQAYHTLFCDDLRAIYLLELAGIDINLDASIDDLDFLGNMMDSRIVLAESQNPQEIAATHAQLDDLQQHIAQSFDQAYEQKNWAMACKYALKLKFLAKLKDDTQNLVAIDDGDDDLYV